MILRVCHQLRQARSFNHEGHAGNLEVGSGHCNGTSVAEDLNEFSN